MPCATYTRAHTHTHTHTQPGSIMEARWPECGEVNSTLLKEAEYLTNVTHEFRVRLKKMVDMRGKVS